MSNNKSPEQADIVIISDNNLGYLGGERESQLIIINGVSKRYKVAVVQPGSFDEEIDNVKFYYCTKSKRMKHLIKNPFAFFLYIFKVGRLIKKINPQIIHTNSQVSFFIISLLRRFRLISRDIVFLHTDRGLYTKYNSFFKKLFHFSFKYLDTLITTTDYNKDCWLKANSQKRIDMEYCVIENTAGKIYETIEESKVAQNEHLTVGFAGRMCDWKDWPLAEEICTETDKISSKTRYIMYVSCLDDKAKAETERMFSRMKEKFSERFVGKINVPFEDMEAFYYNIDVYVLTSWPHSESFGRTIVEAMSRKTAVLTTDAGGSVEVVNDRTTICNTSVEFAEHINFWDKNRAALEKVKDANFERVRSVYTLENNVSKHLSLYDSKTKESN